MNCLLALYRATKFQWHISGLNLKSISTVKPVLSGHSKIDKTKILTTNGSLMKVESIGAFCNAFDLH